MFKHNETTYCLSQSVANKINSRKEVSGHSSPAYRSGSLLPKYDEKS